LNPKPQQVIQSIKTRIIAEFPVKTSAKYYHLTVGAPGQAKWAEVA